MTWLQRYRYRFFLRSSIWVGPTVGLVSAIAAYLLVLDIDRQIGAVSPVAVESARAVIGALSSAMLTFIVFVLTALLVVVQLASAQLTPRIIASAMRMRGSHTALGVFVFTFTFSLAQLTAIDKDVPLVGGRLAIWSSLACVCVFLYLVDTLAKSLRPICILADIARSGGDIVRHVYPQALGERRSVAVPKCLGAARLEVEHRGRSGVLLAFDGPGLVELARRIGGVIEIVPQVGDFVAQGELLFRVHGGTADGSVEMTLRHSAAFGPERTLEQDPCFAFRIIVDIANKALSPAINDPTTAVLALDQIHLLLRLVGLRRLDTGRACDAQGALRLVFNTPEWADFVRLGLTEIRHYGGGSIQVMRRMRALLEHLIRSMPEDRQPCLREELLLLERSVERSFADAEDRRQALCSDLQGLGGSAVSLGVGTEGGA
jgi:uncharacterized membrane protein